MILSATFGFILGIASASFFYFDFWSILALFLGGFISFSFYYFRSNVSREKFWIFTLFFVFFILGVFRINVSDLYSESKLKDFDSKKIIVSGVIVSEPDIRDNNTKYTIEVQKIFPSGDNNLDIRLVTTEKILVTLPLYPKFNYGDEIKVNVSLQKPKLIENEDGRIFNYEGYLRVRGIWYTSNYSTAEPLSSGNGNIIKHWLFKTKNIFTNSIENVLPQPESSLLGGLLLGSKQSLGKDLLNDFQRTGISHIVVLSGYNIAIVADSIINFFKFLPKNISFGFGTVGIILFTILSGSGSSGVRASIMVLIALFAKHSNRDYKSDRILGFTIFAMLLYNPLLLIFDPSFQLSILATIGIIFVSPVLEKYFKNIPEKFGMREIFSTTIATQITVLPLLIYSTGIVSFVSLPVNVLILGTIPITMFFGFITGLLGLFSMYLAFVPAFFTYVLLWYQLKIVAIGSSVSFGVISLPAFSSVFLFFIYILLFWLFYKIKN